MSSNSIRIPFNKPFLTGKETEYIKQAVESGRISGNGIFTKKCHRFFEEKFGFKKCLLTTSCTAALEMAAILINTVPGDEIIMPSFTFVSTANAFVLRGATIRFADSSAQNPNFDTDSIEPLINERTKAIVPVHYGGIANNMDKIMKLAERYNLFVIEDAAHAIAAYYKEKPLGSIGHLSAFSFHETKNIIAGEGGMLVINDERLIKRAEIIREKGTDRPAFFRGEIDKYSWVDIGSSFLPSEITAAFLYAQLENMETIQNRRNRSWERYYQGLRAVEREGKLMLPYLPEYAENNGHLFYVVCRSEEERTRLLQEFRAQDIWAVFHYVPLHSSPFYKMRHDGRLLPNADHFSRCLLRLPMFYDLSEAEIDRIVLLIRKFYGV